MRSGILRALRDALVVAAACAGILFGAFAVGWVIALVAWLADASTGGGA